jgi:hypothetical protein
MIKVLSFMFFHILLCTMIIATNLPCIFCVCICVWFGFLITLQYIFVNQFWRCHFEKAPSHEKKTHKELFEYSQVNNQLASSFFNVAIYDFWLICKLKKKSHNYFINYIYIYTQTNFTYKIFQYLLLNDLWSFSPKTNYKPIV